MPSLSDRIFDIGYENITPSSDIRTPEQRTAGRQRLLQAFDEQVKHLKSIKTGCISVSDPELGISESSLGDATLLPVSAIHNSVTLAAAQRH